MPDNLLTGRKEEKEQHQTIESCFPSRIDDCASRNLASCYADWALKIYLQCCQKGKSAVGQSRAPIAEG